MNQSHSPNSSVISLQSVIGILSKLWSLVTLIDEETSIAICQCEHYVYELSGSL